MRNNFTQIIALLSLISEAKDLLLRKCHFQINKPKMKYQEMMIIVEILRRKKPQHCLEWGSGYSSLFFPRYLESAARWIAVEHNSDWDEKIKRLNDRPNTEFNLIKPNNFPWTDEHHDGAYADLKDYIEFPKSLGVRFDFILIDGQARKECLTISRDILASDGIIVLHNANREYYHEALKYYRHQVLFYEGGIDNGLWVGSTNLNIEKVLDIKKHTQIWDTSNKLRRVRKSFYSLFRQSPALSN